MTSRARAHDDDADVVAFADRDRDWSAELAALGVKTRADAVADLRRMQKLPRYSTAFPSLTHSLGLGWFATQLYVLVGGPGAGKTSLLLQIGRDFASEHGATLLMSEEMSIGHCIARMLARDLGTTTNALITAAHTVTDEELIAQLPETFHYISREPLEKVHQAIAIFKRMHGGVMLLIDYFGKLVDLVLEKMERPDDRLATSIVSTKLTTLARELEIPIVAISEGSRYSIQKVKGTRNGKRQDPRQSPPSDFMDTAKGSGKIEYDSAGLLTLNVSDEKDCDGFLIGTLTVAKARYGGPVHIAMAFDGATGRWFDRGPVEYAAATNIKPGAAAEVLSAEMQELRTEMLAILEHGPQSRRGVADAIRKAGGKVHLQTVGAAAKVLLARGELAEIGKGKNAKLALPTPTLPGLEGGQDGD